jgi:hypothetical protein
MSAADRLVLGPVVGHTSHESALIWIQVDDDPKDYVLSIAGGGQVRFVSTELPGALEFRTAIARADGLRADWRHRYAVLRHGSAVPNGRGTFRTMPHPGSMANLTFVAISCNVENVDGAWKALAKYIDDAQPQFLLMVGDQLYLDEGKTNLFDKQNRNLPRKEMRAAIAEKYRGHWGRRVVRDVLANIPTYMVWDDHDIRDGWGSSASDSPTLVARYPRGKRIFDKCQAYFENCRDASWHFQASHNPGPGDGISTAAPNYVAGIPPPATRQAMPYAFRCGRLAVLMLDSRGERDVFREKWPILGMRQWQFIEQVFANLPPDVDALAVITPTPIASIDPEGPTMRIMGDRTDDVDAFEAGDEDDTLDPHGRDSTLGKVVDVALTIANVRLSGVTSRLLGKQLNLGNYKISNIDEARDQWSQKYSRAEQAELIRAAGKARLANRNHGTPRGLVFVSGDIHVGARFKIVCEDPPYEALSLTASGINTVHDSPPTIDVLLSRDFEVAPGITSTLQEVVVDFNFGVVQVVPTRSGAEIQGAVVHKGSSTAFGVDINLWL